MKLVAALVASAFAVTAFAAEPAKKDEKKAAPAAATAPAKDAKPAAKSDAKAAPKSDAKAADKKAEAAKK